MKFKYGDKVEITKGFYRSQKGKIIEIDKFPFFTTQYALKIKGLFEEPWFKETDIKIVKNNRIGR